MSWSNRLDPDQTRRFVRLDLGPICLQMYSEDIELMRPPGFWGIWGEWLFIFRELGSTGNYFQGFGEQAHSFGDLGSPAKM